MGVLATLSYCPGAKGWGIKQATETGTKAKRINRWANWGVGREKGGKGKEGRKLSDGLMKDVSVCVCGWRVRVNSK